jgi:hypothetical protein
MHAAFFNGRSLRVFILVDHVLVGRLVHDLLDFGFDPGSAEGGEILLRVAVQDELVVDGLVDSLRVPGGLWELIGFGLSVQSFGFNLAGGTGFELFGVVQRHGFSCYLNSKCICCRLNQGRIDDQLEVGQNKAEARSGTFRVVMYVREVKWVEEWTAVWFPTRYALSHVPSRPSTQLQKEPGVCRR